MRPVARGHFVQLKIVIARLVKKMEGGFAVIIFVVTKRNVKRAMLFDQSGSAINCPVKNRTCNRICLGTKPAVQKKEKNKSRKRSHRCCSSFCFCRSRSRLREISNNSSTTNGSACTPATAGGNPAIIAMIISTVADAIPISATLRKRVMKAKVGHKTKKFPHYAGTFCVLTQKNRLWNS